ncbi:FMN reductase [Prauserella marina]|uniref:NAD(P)H-dependent oxidoreductase n=1 Tax=Prauserella marina TaxID=530584 RepID=UPI000B8105E6|nr:NAD(P)H-dependent oxidoreductase [Prauserella marina]ASR36371.1 FMN reductase [Prauserella marina]
MSVRILALVGSLRSGSHNRRLADVAVGLAPADVDLRVHQGLGELPFYNEDIDAEGLPLPAEVIRLRESAKEADGFLLFSPEYNGTMPAVLKNAIDWLSRPFGEGAMRDKPVAVVGIALGRFGGEWAQDEARKAAGIAGAAVLDGVKLSIPVSATRFAETHPADDAEVRAQLTEVVTSLRDKAAVAA